VSMSAMVPPGIARTGMSIRRDPETAVPRVSVSILYEII